MKKLDVKPLLAPLASVFVAFGVASDKILRRRRPRISSTRLTVNEDGIGALGSEVEALWTDRLDEGTRLFADRRAAVLCWHFKIPGDRGSVRVLRCYDNGKLNGYAVVRTDKDPQDGIRRSIIADLIARRDDPTVIQALCVAAYEHAKAEGSDILEVQGFPSNIREVLSAWRPYHRKYPACPYYYKASDPEFHKTLSDPSAWYACPFDGDATLIRPSYPGSTVSLAKETVRSPLNDGAVELAKAQRTEAF